jgi:hypothetical protein
MPRRLAIFFRRRRYLNLVVALLGVLGVVACGILVQQRVAGWIMGSVVAVTAAAWLLLLIIIYYRRTDPQPPEWAGEGGVDVPDFDDHGADDFGHGDD